MKTLLVVATVLAVNIAVAAPIYKSVDKYGNVSYSETPPDNADQIETVNTPPPPNEQEVARAKQRYLELEMRDAMREQERRELAKQQQEINKQKAYADLKRKLEKQKRPNVIVINQNPNYRRAFPGWIGAGKPVPLAKDHKGMTHHKAKMILDTDL